MTGMNDELRAMLRAVSDHSITDPERCRQILSDARDAHFEDCGLYNRAQGTFLAPAPYCEESWQEPLRRDPHR
jgi:hypothetical protein